jgi:hypothetical protein
VRFGDVVSLVSYSDMMVRRVAVNVTTRGSGYELLVLADPPDPAFCQFRIQGGKRGHPVRERDQVILECLTMPSYTIHLHKDIVNVKLNRQKSTLTPLVLFSKAYQGHDGLVTRFEGVTLGINGKLVALEARRWEKETVNISWRND